MKYSLLTIRNDIFAPCGFTYGSIGYADKKVFKFAGSLDENSVKRRSNQNFLMAVLAHKIFVEVAGFSYDNEESSSIAPRLRGITLGKTVAKHTLSPKELIKKAISETSSLFLNELARIEEFLDVTAYIECVGETQVDKNSTLKTLKEMVPEEQLCLYKQQIKTALADQFNLVKGKIECGFYSNLVATSENIHLILACLILTVLFNHEKVLETASKEEKEKIECAIKSFFETQLRTVKSKPKTKIRHVTLEELVELGVTIEDAAKAIVENDKALYGDLGADENEGTPETWQKFMEANTRSFQFLINEKKQIIGNFSYVALSQSQVMLCESGNILEAEFTPRNTTFSLFPGKDALYGFLLNFSCNVLYTTRENINLLFDAFCEELLHAGLFGTFFQGFYVNVFLEDHKAMYEQMGFTYKTENKPHGTIYHLDLTKIPTFGWWNNHKELINLYHEYFSTTKE